MWGPISIVVAALLLGLLTVAIVFVLGMRTKTPWVLNGVRRFARAVGNPHVMRTAGTPGATASVIKHRGRTSGRAYETPVAAVATEDGFVIATVYGSRTDWLKNVLGSGSATIVNEGHTYEVDRPEVIPIEAAAACFPAEHRRTFRRYRVDQCLRVRRVEPSPEGTAEPLAEPR
jgi:deazaflavin-dependent oxidoreductase (nitroreductase family)